MKRQKIIFDVILIVLFGIIGMILILGGDISWILFGGVLIGWSFGAVLNKIAENIHLTDISPLVWSPSFECTSVKSIRIQNNEKTRGESCTHAYNPKPDYFVRKNNL